MDSIKSKILVIDDSPFNLKYLKENLGDEYCVYVSDSSVDAVNLIKKTIPDLILLDIVMPVINGYDLCKLIKIEKELWAIPVIFITSMDNEDDIVKGFDAGAVDYIKKPFILSELKAHLKTHLRIKKLEKYLFDQNRILVETNNKKNQFIGMAAHDLRNPLQAIMGYADLILFDYEENGNNTDKTYLNKIIESSNFMLALINEILDVAVIENGHLKINSVRGSIIDVVKSNVDYNSRLSAKKNIDINVVINDDVPLELYFDPVKIEQVMNNLVSNAVKYSHEGKEINIYIKKEDNYVFVEVKDHGL
ncbi:MAG: hybrid sensor histidine kinase/response regulator, partial [Candidatus Muirbacterium halophilum]|nr:hybrid sensor histidine kinase/response regulator [Candidatus Muirbacterium halophilum]